MLKAKIWILIWWYKTIKGYRKISTKLLYAKAKHETGNFTSEVFEQNNNLFGMRHPKIRENRSQGSNLNHAVFKSHRESIIDYFLRQKYFEIDSSSDVAYVNSTVNSGYAEDPAYQVKWENLARKTKTPTLVNLIAYGGLFFLLLILFLIFKQKRK